MTAQKRKDSDTSPRPSVRTSWYIRREAGIDFSNVLSSVYKLVVVSSRTVFLSARAVERSAR